MTEAFMGAHAEWNLGSPGGWDYQRVTQELGEELWLKVKRESGLDIELDFTPAPLNPAPGFADFLLRAHRLRHGAEQPYILIVAEKETLDSVVENSNMVRRLNSMEGVDAELAAPHELESRGGRALLRGRAPTVIFMDFNNDTLLHIHGRDNCEGLLQAVRDNITVNPRGMEPVGVKCVFELIGTELRDRLEPETVRRTPWTRKFFERSTAGPDGSEIPDLPAWAERNWTQVVLKPENGYSGKGVFVGKTMPARARECIDHALKAGDYILQELIPVDLWAEEFPELDHEAGTVMPVKRQTDFRCFVTDAGLMGFVGRFGGIPTNVGAGGGTHAVAVLRGGEPAEAVRRINHAVIGLGYEFMAEAKSELDREAVARGHVYLNGPIPLALRPRLITGLQLDQLRAYAVGLWTDGLRLAGFWRQGGMDRTLDLDPGVRSLAELQPWTGQPGLMASDGLFSFGAHVKQADAEPPAHR